MKNGNSNQHKCFVEDFSALPNTWISELLFYIGCQEPSIVREIETELPSISMGFSKVVMITTSASMPIEQVLTKPEVSEKTIQVAAERNQHQTIYVGYIRVAYRIRKRILWCKDMTTDVDNLWISFDMTH